MSRKSKLRIKPEFNFPVAGENFRLMDEHVKAANVAVNNRLIQSFCQQNNLRLVKYVEGYWKSGIDKNSENSFQDIVVFEK